jgi:ppGpp synthetase/RelA/SpoT-type nucleotidyltranferase
MKNQYSVDEILEAVNELNSLREEKNIDVVTSRVKKKNQ